MKQLAIILSVIFMLTSCGNNESNHSSGKIKKDPAPLTYETAFQKAFGARVSTVFDTLALGYHWGMTKAQTTAHVKALAQSKRVFYKSNKGYMYKMPLTHYDESGNKTEDYVFRILTEHYKDTLKVLNLWIRGSDNNHHGYLLAVQYNDLTIEDLYHEFTPVFTEKGFICKKVDPSMTLDEDAKHGIPAAEWDGAEYRFVKDNTLIRLWRGKEWYTDFFISYYDMSVLYKEQQDVAEKEAIAAKKAAEENAAKEEQKKDKLRDF